MPRILSNNNLAHHHRRRSSVTSSTSSLSSSRSSSSRQSVIADWFSIFTGYPNAGSSSPLSSQPTSGSSTPPLPSPTTLRNSSRRQIIIHERRSSAPAAVVSYGVPPMEDSWGQFVDTAKAEEELVRHSRVLSRKERKPIALS